jgi:hypothetical protein
MKSKRISLLLVLALMLGACGTDTPASDTATSVDAIATTTTAPETTTETEATTDMGPYTGLEYRLPAYFDGVPALKETYAGIFKSGTAINSEFLVDTTTDYYQTVAKHYDVLVTENEKKPHY